uniref:MobV family relaxase n=1 Tax=uncultured Caulobacter sp. TaxID=158749 RepID=UPI0025D08AD9|nr:MobV family relaxase [uncultured Caulobacter sp.]
MAYAILRTAKLKSFGEIGGSLAHTFRERETHNADPALKLANEHWGAETGAGALAAIRAALPAKYRSDAVLCIEYFVGHSPEWRGDDAAYFRGSLHWLCDRHGAENVISAHVHRDEKTPHLVAYVVPRDGDKLNAKKWLGGKKTLSEMQTDFWQRVGREHGLERGIEGSVARHQTVKEYYSTISRAADLGRDVTYPKERQALERGILTTIWENDEAFAGRVAGAVVEQLKPAVQKGVETMHLARRERDQAREVGRLTKELDDAHERLDVFERVFDGLSSSQIKELFQALQRAAGRMRETAREVVGWFKGLAQSRSDGEWKITLEERGSGKIVTFQSDKAAIALDRAEVRPGDLVRVSRAGAEILERQRGYDLER